MIVLGIDPGSQRTGYGLVRREGARLSRLDSGTIRTTQKAEMGQRLLEIQDGIDALVARYAPEGAALEDVFFAKNAHSALVLGQVRGVVLCTLARRQVAVHSYPPAFVKRSVVGAGRAEKSQVQRVVQAILGLAELPAEDEGDALALAICHLNAPRLPQRR